MKRNEETMEQWGKEIKLPKEWKHSKNIRCKKLT
jgi:hypothetical protein